MNSVNKTLYIPLYGKAYVSRRGLFLKDPKAEEIWAAEEFPLRGKAASKWLAFYMGIRAAVFDDWVRRKLEELPEAAVVHIGCGMDSRVLRAGRPDRRWYDVDFPSVIEERKRYYTETAQYTMLPGDARQADWLEKIPERVCIAVLEGVSMYLRLEELQGLFRALAARFEEIVLLTDCYTVLAAKLSGMRNPVKDVGVHTVYGLDDPAVLQAGGLTYVQAHEMTPKSYTEALCGAEKAVFQKLYAGRMSEKLYRLYEYEKK